MFEELKNLFRKKTEPEELQIYATGLIACSVCTNITNKKRIEQLVNRKSPTGISSSWRVSKDKKFATGQSMPCPCEQNPKNRHYLLKC